MSVYVQPPRDWRVLHVVECPLVRNEQLVEEVEAVAHGILESISGNTQLLDVRPDQVVHAEGVSHGLAPEKSVCRA